VAALPHDRIGVVAEEKLFGDDGARTGAVTGAWEGDALVGLIALAGRYVKLLAVSPAHEGRGVGSALLELAPKDARVGDHPGNYLSPGIDVRYERGLAFLQKRGYAERGRVENLRTPMLGNPRLARTDRAVADVVALGYRVTQPDGDERARALHMIASQFAPVWAKEAGMAASGPRRALFVAWHGEEPVAFAAADGNNQGLGWFGPAGTLPAHRGKKLGEALLLSCLRAVDGLPEAGVIAWIGPKPFYERAVGSVSDRQFVQLERVAS